MLLVSTRINYVFIRVNCRLIIRVKPFILINWNVYNRENRSNIASNVFRYTLLFCYFFGNYFACALYVFICYRKVADWLCNKDHFAFVSTCHHPLPGLLMSAIVQLVDVDWPTCPSNDAVQRFDNLDRPQFGQLDHRYRYDHSRQQ